MSDRESSQSQKKASASTDGGKQQLQQVFDEAQEKGYFGVTPDVTPNANYTVKGVTSGAPTPETDEAQAEKVAQAQRKLAREGSL